MGYTLYDYQRDTVNKIIQAWSTDNHRCAAVLGTGAGKTVILAHLLDEYLPDHGRAIVIAHRDELVRQAYDTCTDTMGGRRTIGRATADRTDVRAEIVAGMIGSLIAGNRLARILRHGWPDVVIVDECHHSTAPTYRWLLWALGAGDRPGDPETAYARRMDDIATRRLTEHPEHKTRLLGLTATLMRTDNGVLGHVYHRVVAEYPMEWLIDHGYLMKPRGVRVKVAGLDFRKVKRVNGHFDDNSLAEALTENLAPHRVIDAYRQYADGKPGFCFVPTVEFAHMMSDMFNQAGIPSAAVTGETPKKERAGIVERFRQGGITMLCNVGVFTEGTDLPRAQVAIMMRATKSKILWTQMVGRIVRKMLGKLDALVLDIVGITGRLQIASLVDLGYQYETGPEVPDEWVDSEGDLIRPEPAEREDQERLYGEGEYSATVVDLFTSRSQYPWVCTERGNWTLPVGDRAVVVIPYTLDTGAQVFNVADYPMVRIGATTPVGTPTWVEILIPGLDTAMSVAEEYANRISGHSVHQISARWRKRMAGEKQLSLAIKYGMSTSGDDTHAGAVADFIDQARASRSIDSALGSAWDGITPIAL